jgi:hypothetical protein
MDEADLEKTFLLAAEIAKKLPENLQEAGFNRAIEQLLGKASPASGGRPLRRAAVRDVAEPTDESRSELIESVDRTAYPDIGASTRVGDRALKVLLLAHQDYGVDGLTADEIAKILSRKFRLPTKANSVAKALDRETNTVDVRSDSGASRVFHIMAPGEEYLARLRAGKSLDGKGGDRTSRTTKHARRLGKVAATKTPSQETVTVEATFKKKGIGKKVAGRPGPKAAIGQLLGAGFFRSAKMISEIQEELQHRRGHSYSVQELAPALVRSVRDESLSRERNGEGQYEYREA